jgi:hypothetical protein
VKTAGLLGDGFGATPEMSKRNLIWVVSKIQLLVEQYPSWYVSGNRKLPYPFLRKHIFFFTFNQISNRYSLRLEFLMFLSLHAVSKLHLLRVLQ